LGAALTALRNADSLTQEHPDHVFVTAPLALRQWREGGTDIAPFYAGLTALRPRYAALGLTDLLPLDRVLVGVTSTRQGARGGFHHPNQGYRHLQMRALVTMYGDMDTPRGSSLAVLDLLRAYAHDCLHYGSYRSYQMRDGRPMRTQYGINFRRADGRSYSAPDGYDATGTRNLGVVMEGACDREARSITRQIATAHGITADGGIDDYALRDVTGRLDVVDLPPGLSPEESAYLTSMGKYQAGVNTKYTAFLEEIAGAEAEDLHTTILASVISGSMVRLCAWLDKRHGPGSFAALFMAPRYMELVLAS
jgi:hypothetical protein